MVPRYGKHFQPHIRLQTPPLESSELKELTAGCFAPCGCRPYHKYVHISVLLQRHAKSSFHSARSDLRLWSTSGKSQKQRPGALCHHFIVS